MRLLRGGAPATFRDWWTDLGDPEVAAWAAELLLDVPWEAVFWEHPAQTEAGLGSPAEFVQIPARGLADVRADRGPFDEHFAMAWGDIVSFDNLRGDAHLIVPAPLVDDDVYVHLLSFLRDAPEDQRAAFFATVGAEVLLHVGRRPLWVSTAGMGVSWLHLRLDQRPKYYRFGEYRDR